MLYTFNELNMNYKNDEIAVMQIKSGDFEIRVKLFQKDETEYEIYCGVSNFYSKIVISLFKQFNY